MKQSTIMFDIHLTYKPKMCYYYILWTLLHRHIKKTRLIYHFYSKKKSLSLEIV